MLAAQAARRPSAAAGALRPCLSQGQQTRRPALCMGLALSLQLRLATCWNPSPPALMTSPTGSLPQVRLRCQCRSSEQLATRRGTAWHGMQLLLVPQGRKTPAHARACRKMPNPSRDFCVPYKQICRPSMSLPCACWLLAAEYTILTGVAQGRSADRPEPAGAKDAEGAGSPARAPFRVLLYSLQRHTYRHELTFSSPVQALR